MIALDNIAAEAYYDLEILAYFTYAGAGNFSQWPVQMYL